MTTICRTIRIAGRRPADCLRAIRRSLKHAGLRISGELDIAQTIDKDLPLTFMPCRILFVDCPVLLLEALALDQRAGVLVPLHLVITREAGGARVHWINPAEMPGLRSSLAFRNAMNRLDGRITQALASLSGGKTSVSYQRETIPDSGMSSDAGRNPRHSSAAVPAQAPGD
jgi:uncharacterized protein (DUF302 family)